MALQWIDISSADDIERIISRSREVPCLIFKHSTRCNISAIARYRLEDDWESAPEELETYYLDLLRYRSVSDLVAETFQVYHESPQVLLISNGTCIYDASHLDITVEELKEILETV